MRRRGRDERDPRRVRSAVAGAAALAVVLAACSEDDAGGRATTTSEATSTTATSVGADGGLPEDVVVLGADEDLYALADDLEPGEPGQPIAVQPVETELDAHMWRVLHHSRSLEGEAIAVSGLVIVPRGDAPAEGRPVVSWAHGTTGIADECAPSRTFSQLPAVVPLLEQGMVVVATDYEGLGTPGRHPYLVGESQGRGVLDVVRAAQALGPAVGAGEQVLLWGHSQGGHAVLFANEIAEAWAPELDVVGAVAGAPPSQLPLMAQFIGNGPGSFFLAMVVAGWAEAFPEADPSAVLTDAGLERLDAVDGGCLDHVVRTWGAPTTEDLVRPAGAEVEPWSSLFVSNDPGGRAGTAPVLVLHGGEDEVVPAATSALLVDRMCQVGQPVQRIVYDADDHTSVVLTSRDDMLAWMAARLAGTPAPDDCATR